MYTRSVRFNLSLIWEPIAVWLTNTRTVHEPVLTRTGWLVFNEQNIITNMYVLQPLLLQAWFCVHHVMTHGLQALHVTFSEQPIPAIQVTSECISPSYILERHFSRVFYAIQIIYIFISILVCCVSRHSVTVWILNDAWRGAKCVSRQHFQAQQQDNERRHIYKSCRWTLKQHSCCLFCGCKDLVLSLAEIRSSVIDDDISWCGDRAPDSPSVFLWPGGSLADCSLKLTARH